MPGGNFETMKFIVLEPDNIACGKGQCLPVPEEQQALASERDPDLLR